MEGIPEKDIKKIFVYYIQMSADDEQEISYDFDQPENYGLQKLNTRAWVFVLNNWTEEEYQKILSIKHNYLIVGKEIGKSGTPHLQGYIYNANKITFGHIKKICPRVHLQVAKGTAIQNRRYCSKDGDFIESGKIPEQGKRNDLTLMKEVLAVNPTMSAAIEVAPNYQSLRAAELLLKYSKVKRDWKPEVIWLYGKPRTGKTNMAKKMVGKEYYLKHSHTGKWWDGYDGEENVIIDEVKYNYDYDYLLALLDAHECRVEQKGSSRQFLAKKIVLTSTHLPEHWFGEDTAEIRGRITKIINIEDLEI